MKKLDYPPPFMLQSGPLTAFVSPFGAELLSLINEGREWLWQGDDASWPRRAPILFPFCGRVYHKTIWVDGLAYPNQPIHGFAPQSTFSVLHHGPNHLVLELTGGPETHALYPFRFELSVTFRLDEMGLVQTLTCRNPNTRPLPVSAGFHPGFVWPLPGTKSQADHQIIFEQIETESVALPDEDGLIGGQRLANPVQGRVLHLDQALFRAGSVIFDRLKSRSLWFGVPVGFHAELSRLGA